MDVKLVMFKSNGQRKDFPIVNPTTSIGRGENCDLQVPLLSVSRRHCEFLLSGNRLMVKDGGSSNGTYVNNKRVTAAALNAGDRVVVGPIVFTVQIDGEPETITPVKTRGDQLAKEAGDVIALGAAASAPADEEADIFDLGSDQQEGGEIDPIAALEALAGKQDQKKGQ